MSLRCPKFIPLLVVFYLGGIFMKFILLTGADGVGKTTFYQQYLNKFENYRYFSLEKQLSKMKRNWRKTSDWMMSYKEMIQSIQKTVDEHKNIILEMPLSGSVHMIEQWVEKAKDQGYECILIWIQTSSFELAYNRVIQRVKLGGIGVDRQVAEQRFIKQEKMVNSLAPIFDCVEYWENNQQLIRLK